MVSPLTLGTMEFGTKVDDDQANDLFDAALDSGVNVVDTANVYGGGRSEELVGRLIARRRDRLLVATKFSVATDETDPNSSGTSRHNVITACEASLRRLQTDHIDIYYVHRPFTQIAIDETLRALDDLVRSGKIRYIGLSGSAGWQIVDALWCASDLKLNRPAVEQVAYHLLDRRCERDLVPAALTYGTALTVWSPLAGGLLTGKYLHGAANGWPAVSRQRVGGQALHSTGHRGRGTTSRRGGPDGGFPYGPQSGLDPAAIRRRQPGPRAAHSSTAHRTTGRVGCRARRDDAG